MVKFPKHWTSEPWYNGTRHVFELDGRKTWIVEPKKPAGDGRWTWCMIWPEAFVKRVGVMDFLDNGFYHAHIDALDTYASPEKGIPLLRKFHQQCVDLGLAPKANLIGLSWGGFFSLRFAYENPDKVACMYLDAPLCNMVDEEKPSSVQRTKNLSEAYHLSIDEMASSPLNPVNTGKALAKAGIPILVALGEDDLSVPVERNFNLFEEDFLAAGGKATVIRRPYWGHHPHGFDDTSQLLQFMLDHLPENNC